MTTRPGKLIVFEGTDGTGKTTQRDMLAKYLMTHGYATLITKEPTEGPYGMQIRDLYRNRNRYSPEEELELFLADRRDHVVSLLLPNLQEGKIILCDRYYFSTAAYQGALGLDPETILALNDFAPEPTLSSSFGPASTSATAHYRTGGDTPNNLNNMHLWRKLPRYLLPSSDHISATLMLHSPLSRSHHQVIQQVMNLLNPSQRPNRTNHDVTIKNFLLACCCLLLSSCARTTRLSPSSRTPGLKGRRPISPAPTFISSGGPTLNSLDATPRPSKPMRRLWSQEPRSQDCLKDKIPVLLLKMGEYDKAASWLHQALIDNPEENNDRAFPRPDCYVQQNKIKTRQSHFLTKPSRSIPTTRISICALVSSSATRKISTKLRKFSDNLLQKNADSYLARLSLARLLKQVDKADEATSEYQKALDLNWSKELAYEIGAYFASRKNHAREALRLSIP